MGLALETFIYFTFTLMLGLPFLAVAATLKGIRKRSRPDNKTAATE